VREGRNQRQYSNRIDKRLFVDFAVNEKKISTKFLRQTNVRESQYYVIGTMCFLLLLNSF
jgi:hypothetical protein